MNAIQQIIGWMPALLQATGVTLALSVTSVLTALVLAVFLALGKISKKHRTPLRVRCVHLLLPRHAASDAAVFPLLHAAAARSAFNIQSRFLAAWIAFSLNVAAYLAEIIRAAIQSIDKGQLEASTALGLTHSQAMRLVIIPQAYRRMIPPICNEFVMVLKDTSLVSHHRADRFDLPDEDYRFQQGERSRLYPGYDHLPHHHRRVHRYFQSP